MVLTGGCHCGAIRYEAAGEPAERALCHCRDCQRCSGAPAIAWFTVERAHFRLTAGAPATYASSAHAVRTFCPTCGAQLTFVHDSYGGARLDITTASLDEPAAAAPREHIWTRSRISWMTGLDSLPEHSMADRP